MMNLRYFSEEIPSKMVKYVAGFFLLLIIKCKRKNIRKKEELTQRGTRT